MAPAERIQDMLLISPSSNIAVYSPGGACPALSSRMPNAMLNEITLIQSFLRYREEICHLCHCFLRTILTYSKGTFTKSSVFASWIA